MVGDEPWGRNSDDSLPQDIAAVPPLTIDEDSPMEAAEEEFEENYERPFRDNAARTLFHAPRGDYDTV